MRAEPRTRFEMYLERVRARRPAKEAWREEYKKLRDEGMSIEEIQRLHPPKGRKPDPDVVG